MGVFKSTWLSVTLGRADSPAEGRQAEKTSLGFCDAAVGLGPEPRDSTSFCNLCLSTHLTLAAPTQLQDLALTHIKSIPEDKQIVLSGQKQQHQKCVCTHLHSHFLVNKTTVR